MSKVKQWAWDEAEEEVDKIINKLNKILSLKNKLRKIL